jgi:hypothetical protein
MLSDRAHYNLSEITGFTELLTNGCGNDNNKTVLKLNQVECRTSNNVPYKVVRYDKDMLSIDSVETYGLCRSVIVNNENTVVGFAPPKSMNVQEFITRYTMNVDASSNVSSSSSSSSSNDNIIAEEFVEGTMINVFWDKTLGVSGGWEISTRNTVGATSRFYKSKKSKTFRDMFLEAANSSNISFSRLNPNYCYSFVLQHPENRIVVPFKVPKLYLVAVYFIDNSVNNSVVIYPQDMESIKNANWEGTTIFFPERYTFTTYSELIEKYGSMNSPYDVMGVVIYNNNTGVRAKIRNPVYEQVRFLRGNQPKLQYQYLCLRKDGKVSDFLKFYPENKKDFSDFRDQIHLFTNTLYSNYVSCYIKKEKPLAEYIDQYRTHMYTLHQVYMNELREKNQYITKSVVQNYVNNIHPSLLMYCLNYHMRKRNIDKIKPDLGLAN